MDNKKIKSSSYLILSVLLAVTGLIVMMSKNVPNKFQTLAPLFSASAALSGLYKQESKK